MTGPNTAHSSQNQAQVLEAASGIDAGGGFSDFIFWRGSVPPQDSGAGEAFSHMGLERHRRKHRGGPVTDIFVYSGPTRDQVHANNRLSEGRAHQSS